MKFALRYELHDAGWATAYLEHNLSSKMTVSYLHDTLKQLACSALEVGRDCSGSTVFFLDEPGEHQLILTRKSNRQFEYQLRWYDDWESWGLISKDRFKVVTEGEVSAKRYNHQVVQILHDIYENIGIEAYKQRWVEHEFPLAEYQALCAA